MDNPQYSDKLSEPISSLPGIGDVIEKNINKLGVFSIKDMLFHLPLK